MYNELIASQRLLQASVVQLSNGQQIVIPAGQVIQGQTIQVQGSQPGQMQQVNVKNNAIRVYALRFIIAGVHVV